MQVTRKIAAAAAVATVATLGLATVVSANMLDGATKGTDLADQVSSASQGYAKGGAKHWYWVKKDGGLVAVDGNRVGPFQACHNQASGAGIGGAINADDVAALVGIDSDGNSATAVKTCEQDNEQNRKWYKADGNGVVSVSDNKLGPWQVCHNEISGTGIGGNVPLSNPTGILGLDNDGNSIDSLKTCEQATSQNN